MGFNEKKVAIVMGSDSDYQVMKKAIFKLKDFGVKYIVKVISAHRTPDLAREFIANLEDNNIGVVIAAAGKSAHLAGVLAAYSFLPIIGVPIKSDSLDGMDSLLSTVQMPPGVPVATVAIDGAENAAILAVQILGVFNQDLRDKVEKMKKDMQKIVVEKDEKIQKEVEKI